MSQSFHLLDNVGQELVDSGLISSDQLAVAQETKRNLGGDLGHILIKKGFVSEEQILNFLSQRLNIPFVSLSDYTIDPEVTKLVPMSLTKKYHFMPLFKIEDVLTIAMADPLDVFTIDDLRTTLGCRIQPILASAQEIDQLVAENYRLLDAEDHSAEGIEVMQATADVTEDAADRLKEMASGSKVIAEVNRIIQNAVSDRASDIHIEPLENGVKVRNRIDGLLEERIILPKQMQLPIAARVKIISGMDIAERRIPQDGRIRIKMRGVNLDIRVSTYPTVYGEKVVMRLLGKGGIVNLDSIGFDHSEKETFEKIITRPHGIFLVSGPTGSGKSTTLYAALQRLNSQDRNIISIEDPVENEIVGVNQAQVNVKAGMTFASAMRSMLRQDPDVIMVGEIRDQETADIAVRAAITGHMVFSTIHTNTAMGCVVRLNDMEVERFMIASSLVGVMSQRLVRRVCQQCKEPADIEKSKIEAFGLPRDTIVYKGRGCKHCRMSGFAGRLALFELVAINKELTEMIIKGAGETELIDEVRRQGIPDIREQGLSRIKAGLTTIEEVVKVTADD